MVNIYSQIVRITSTMLKVVKLNLLSEHIFVENNIINPITKIF
jgi:hypothetical protein